MIKMRKLMSLVMVFALVVSMTTIGASASDEITAVTCEETDTSNTENQPEADSIAQEEAFEELIANYYTVADREEQVSDVSTSYEESSQIEECILEEATQSDGVDSNLLDSLVSAEEESTTLESSSTGNTDDSVDIPVYSDAPNLNSCEVLIEGTRCYSLAFEVLGLVNEVRESKGRKSLVMDGAALEHAMVRAAQISIYFAHSQPDGAGIGYGCKTNISSENIAGGYSTPEEAVNGWINSVGHYSAMIKSDYVSTGIGVFCVNGLYFWIQNFSKEDGTEVYASSFTDTFTSTTVNIADYRIETKITPSLGRNILMVGESEPFEIWFIETDERLFEGSGFRLPPEGMIYTSSNESVVTVSANGVVTAVGEGTATITATYPGYDLEPWAFDITVCNHGAGYTSEVTTEPTCTAKGTRTYTCRACGDVYTETIDKLGHTWGDEVVTNPATCTENGASLYTCETCGSTKTGIIFATNVHTYDEGVVTTAATCGASGVKTYTCGTCGTTKTAKISPTYNHTYDDGVVGLPATCSTSGTLIHTCTGCGIKMTTYVAATNEHILSDEPTLINEPTCTSYGSKGYFCESCGQMIGSVILIDPVAHAYDEGVAQGKVTCNSVVSMLYTCATCGNTKTSSVYVSHIYDEGVVSTEATCTTKGKTTYTCTLCGKTKKVADIDALGHAEVVDAAVSPTCMETGLTAGSHCERCGLVITAQTTVATTDHSYSSKVVSPTCTTAGYTEHTCASCGDTYQDTPVSSQGHNWDAGTVTTASKCESAGIMTYVCEDCSATKEEVIAATGHSYAKAVTAPSCEEQGYTEYTCTGCGDSYRSDYIDKLGHTMDDGVIQTPATCTEAGSILYSCRECSATTTKEIAATGHSWDDGVVTTVPTCTEEGVKTYTCEHDATHTKTEVIASTGHSYTDTVYAPTCEEGGYTTHTCETCGDSYEDASTSPTGHTWDEGVVTEAATAEETGVMTYTCTVCGQTKDEDIPCIEETSILRGDVDENGVVDVIDCVRLMKHIVDESVEINAAAADMTEDGVIDILDVVRLLRILSLYGDVDLNGTVDSEDANQVLLCLNDQPSVFDDPETGALATLAGDVNEDGAVDARDATQILRHTNNLPSVIVTE